MARAHAGPFFLDLKPAARADEIDAVRRLLPPACRAAPLVEANGARLLYATHLDETALAAATAHTAVARIHPVDGPTWLVRRTAHEQSTIVDVGSVPVGGSRLALFAGPCSVEDEPSLLEIARGVKKAGAHVLRGGAFKPRSHPYAFQGLGSRGLALLGVASQETGLPVVTEVLTVEDVAAARPFAHAFQIGARNMQNVPLLRAVGRESKPVFLKRGFAATVDEWLQSAETILAHGNPHVILCERGVRTFEHATRFTLDVNAIALAKLRTHLPVVADPSHGTGHADLVPAVARAAIAAGADGLMIEVHSAPQNAWSDGAQSLSLDAFERLVSSLRPLAEALGRSL